MPFLFCLSIAELIMIFVLILIVPASAITCEDVRVAYQTKSKAEIQSLKQQATPEQLKEAYKCLALNTKHRGRK